MRSILKIRKTRAAEYLGQAFTEHIFLQIVLLMIWGKHEKKVSHIFISKFDGGEQALILPLVKSLNFLCFQSLRRKRDGRGRS